MSVGWLGLRDCGHELDRGANLVEMALILPFLLLLVVGVVDVGRAFYTYISLTNAAREGVRFASQWPFQSNEEAITELVEKRAKGEPASEGVPWGDIVVVIDGLGTETQPAKPGEPITVTVSQDYTVLLGGGPALRWEPSISSPHH